MATVFYCFEGIGKIAKLLVVVEQTLPLANKHPPVLVTTGQFTNTALNHVTGHYDTKCHTTRRRPCYHPPTNIHQYYHKESYDTGRRQCICLSIQLNCIANKVQKLFYCISSISINLSVQLISPCFIAPLQVACNQFLINMNAWCQRLTNH